MKIKNWQIIAIVVCLILGTILHFTYEWSGDNPIVGIFSATNESTWEHLKLLFYPMTLMAIIGYFVIRNKYKNYWLGQAIGIIVAMLFVVIFFYTYSGIIGKTLLVLDIGSFIVGIILGEYIAYLIIKSEKQYNAEVPSILLIIVIFLAFVIFTFYPPIIPLFEDPIYGTFGLEPKRID